MKARTEIAYRRNSPAEREAVRIELDQVHAPEEALGRKLIKAKYARSAASLEFAEARRRR